MMAKVSFKNRGENIPAKCARKDSAMSELLIPKAFTAEEWDFIRGCVKAYINQCRAGLAASHYGPAHEDVIRARVQLAESLARMME